MQTASFDGERNLKPKLALKVVQNNMQTLFKNQQNKMIVQYDCPNNNLYQFKGQVDIQLNGKQYLNDIELKHFLHRVRYILIISIS